jgi:hypothetical protein
VQAGPKLVRVRMNCVRVKTADRGRPIFIGVVVRVEDPCKNGYEEGARKEGNRGWCTQRRGSPGRLKSVQDGTKFVWRDPTFVPYE